MYRFKRACMGITVCGKYNAFFIAGFVQSISLLQQSFGAENTTYTCYIIAFLILNDCINVTQYNQLI